MAQNKTKENTPEEIKRGQTIGLWIRTGLARKSINVSELARAIDRSRSYISVLANKDGIGARGLYNRASEEIIDDIAAALGIDANEGRRAAGYIDADTSMKPVFHDFTIGEYQGEPIEIIITKKLTQEELDQLRLAVQLIVKEKKVD